MHEVRGQHLLEVISNVCLPVVVVQLAIRPSLSLHSPSFHPRRLLQLLHHPLQPSTRRIESRRATSSCSSCCCKASRRSMRRRRSFEGSTRVDGTYRRPPSEPARRKGGRVLVLCWMDGGWRCDGWMREVRGQRLVAMISNVCSPDVVVVQPANPSPSLAAPALLPSPIQCQNPRRLPQPLHTSTRRVERRREGLSCSPTSSLLRLRLLRARSLGLGLLRDVDVTSWRGIRRAGRGGDGC